MTGFRSFLPAFLILLLSLLVVFERDQFAAGVAVERHQVWDAVVVESTAGRTGSALERFRRHSLIFEN